METTSNQVDVECLPQFIGQGWHATHTGDGKYRQEVVYDSNCGLVASILTAPEWADKARATAVLFAASPELLEVCKQIAALADGQGQKNLLEVAGLARQIIDGLVEAI